jgi:hypothetical protein
MVAEVGRKRGAAEAGLAPARRIEIDDVKQLFMQQKGHLDYFFSQVRRLARCWSGRDAPRPRVPSFGEILNTLG